MTNKDEDFVIQLTPRVNPTDEGPREHEELRSRHEELRVYPAVVIDEISTVRKDIEALKGGMKRLGISLDQTIAQYQARKEAEADVRAMTAEIRGALATVKTMDVTALLNRLAKAEATIAGVSALKQEVEGIRGELTHQVSALNASLANHADAIQRLARRISDLESPPPSESTNYRGRLPQEVLDLFPVAGNEEADEVLAKAILDAIARARRES